MRGMVAPSMPSLSRTSTVALSRRASDSRLRAWWAGSTVLGMSRFYRIILTKCKCEYTFTYRKERCFHGCPSRSSARGLCRGCRSRPGAHLVSPGAATHAGGRSDGEDPAVSLDLHRADCHDSRRPGILAMG